MGALAYSDAKGSGYHRFKKIYGFNKDGSKRISKGATGFRYFGYDYIAPFYVNPNGLEVIYCIPLDIDVKDTSAKWLDPSGKIDWPKLQAFLQQNYIDIFKYTLFVVRSTNGKGLHIGLAISPIVRNENSRQPEFLGKQVQKALIRLLRYHEIGADPSAVGLTRDLPNWRRKNVSKHSQACQLYFNQSIRADIKREKRSVIHELLSTTNALRECRERPRKDDPLILHPVRKTEQALAHLYLELWDNALMSSGYYSMASLIEITGLSKDTLRNILVRRSESCPKWLKVNQDVRGEYELWLDPNFGSVDRATKLAEQKPVKNRDNLFFYELPDPSTISKGQRNQWLGSAAIHFKWCGFSKEETLVRLKELGKELDGFEVSKSYHGLSKIVKSVFINKPELAEIRTKAQLPQVLKSKAKKNIEGPLRGSALSLQDETEKVGLLSRSAPQARGSARGGD